MKSPEMQPTEAYEVSNRIFFRLFQLGNLLQTRSTAKLGITTVQWSVLGALSTERSRDGFSLGALADYLKVSRQNLDGVLSRLERDGYVERVTGDKDRRSRLVFITPKGRTYWQELQAGIDQFYRDATLDLSADERIALAYLFKKLRKNLTDMGDETAASTGDGEAVSDR